MKIERFGKITLINGDCMEYMRECKDKHFDVLVADPPYGDANFQNPPSEEIATGEGNCLAREARGIRNTSASHRIRSLTGRFGRYSRELPPPPQHSNSQSNTGIWWDVAPSEEYFDEMFRVSRNQIIWGGNYFALPPTRCFLVWRKLSISEKFSMAMCEYAWTSFFSNAKWFECAPQGTKKAPRFHPTAKPIALYAWIYNNYCKEGDILLDPYMGSGSSAIAAYELGYEYVGIEIDEIYYEEAKERLLKRMAQKSLFEDI